MPRDVSLRRVRHYLPLYLFVVPSVVLVATFAYYPCASAIYHAFYNWNGDEICEYVGLRNFWDAFADRTLWYGFGVVTVLVFANLIRMVPSIITAVVIHRLRSESASYLYRVLFVVPMIIPGMVALLIWKLFFDPSFGLLNAFLNMTGLMWLIQRFDALVGLGWFLPGQNPVWLGDANLILPSLILWGFPWVGIVGVLIYLAGLQEIDQQVFEAAEIDGITSLTKLWHIELPLILTQVRINLVLMIIGTLQDYGLILILLGDSGGPNGVAMVPGLYMFRSAFVEGRAGYACAIGLIMFVFILILTEVNHRFLRIEK